MQSWLEETETEAYRRRLLSQTLLTKSGTLLSSPISTQNIQEGNDLRYPNADLLNIQVVTSSTDNSNTGVPERALRDHARACESVTNVDRTHYVPRLMLTNVMSLVPKLTEVQEFMNRNKIDLAFITETWLRGLIADSVVNSPEYTILRRDRATDSHGGVCLYIKNDHFKYNHEILWAHLKPTRLPRGFSDLVAATVYHPKQSTANDNSLREHLFDSLTVVEARYPNCVLVICGDFNRFNTQRLTNHFRLKQIVKAPTRKDATLDLIMTNLHSHYCEPGAFPPFGLSDHATVLATPRIRCKGAKSEKYIFKRDMRSSRKAELRRYLSGLDLSLLLSSANTCDQLEGVIREAITTGLDILMPFKSVRFNTKDALWMTPEL